MVAHYLLAAVALISVGGTLMWAQGSPPKFSDYPTYTYTGPVKSPSLDPARPELSPMNAEISATASSPPNFAGHFRLVQFSCGTECTGFVVIDVLTGRRVATDTVDFPYEIGFWQRPELPHGFQYQPESALLVVQGCFLKKPCGSYYYVMVGTDLTLKEVRKFKPQPHRIRHG